MSTKIQIKRGSRAGLPALAPGEYGLTTDSEELFIGGANRNLQIPILGEEGQIPTSQLPKLTAADVGARPDNWIPTAEEVGARPDSWTPTASDVGADPAGSSESALQAAKTYTDQKISEIPTPDVSKQIQNHNESADAHSNQFSNVLKTSGGGTVTMDESFGVGPYDIEVSEDADAGDFTAAQVGYNNVATGMAATNVQDAVTELFQSVSNGKSLIAGAITDKGVSTSATDTFQQMADNIASISAGGGTAEWNTVTINGELEGKIAYFNYTFQGVGSKNFICYCDWSISILKADDETEINVDTKASYFQSIARDDSGNIIFSASDASMSFTQIIIAYTAF